MGSYLGYGLKAGVEGFKSGFNMGQMKWQQNEKKKLEKKQEEMTEAASVFNTMVAQLGEDGAYSEDDMMKINTSYMALGYDTKDRVDGTYKAIQAMDKKTVEENYQWFDFVIEATNGMKSGDAQSIFDTVKPFISGEKGLQIYEGLESITKKKGEIAERPKEVSPYEFYGESPSGVQTGIAESVAGQTPGLEGVQFKQPTAETKPPSVAEKKYDWATEAHQKWLIDPKDPSGINFEEYKKYMGISVTSDKSTGLEKSIQDIQIQGQKAGVPPEQISKAIKDKILGKPTPETTTDINDILFGTQGIMKNYIGSGSQLGDEQRIEIKNNYDIMKPSLDKETQKQTEEYLKQIGIDVNAVVEEPEVLLDIKKKPFWQSDWKYYQGLSVEELYQLADKENDKKAYEELKKRGKIQ